MSRVTGKVLDIFSMSKYCQHCKMNEKERATNEKCKCNYGINESSGGMEVFGWLNIFRNSVQNRNVVYEKVFGDGDSRGYQAVCEERPHGSMKIFKLECINHFCKRFTRKCETLIRQKKLDGYHFKWQR